MKQAFNIIQTYIHVTLGTYMKRGLDDVLKKPGTPGGGVVGRLHADVTYSLLHLHCPG